MNIKIGVHQILFINLLLVLSLNPVDAQTFDVDTLIMNGGTESLINIVVLGDGYLASELGKFVDDANNLANNFFNQRPFQEYQNYFNMFIIKVPSNESGAAENPDALIDNYFGSTFWSGGIERLLVPTRTSNIVNVLANNFPEYDEVIMLVNSSKYGGSGGWVATASTHPDVIELVFHELGHSFGNLADEYWAGAQYEGEAVNMTQETDLELLKWKNWYGDFEIGLYPHDESPSWYRPHQGCKMRYLGSPFCSVCVEALIENIHDLTSPLVSYNPDNTSTLVNPNYPINYNLELIEPLPNTLKIDWHLNGIPGSGNSDSHILATPDRLPGLDTLTVNIEDTTQLLRIDNHSFLHSNSVVWVMENTISDDFYITDSDLIPTVLTAGDTISAICTQVYSGSNSSTLSPNAGYYLSDDITLDPGDQLLGSDESALSSGSPTEVETADLIIPSDTESGGYYILFVADYPDEYDENDESNNVSAVYFYVEEPEFHEFYIIDEDVNPMMVTAGDTVSAGCTHIYGGTGTAIYYPDVGYYLSTDIVWDESDQLLGSDESIIPASMTPVAYHSTDLTIPQDTPDGLYYILFVADFLDEYPEQDEANNVSSVSITIFSHDFYILETEVDPVTVTPGATVTAGCTHIYGGSGTAIYYPDVGYYISTDIVLDDGDQLLGSEESIIPASISPVAHHSTVLTIPVGTPDGTHYMLFVADNNDEYEEKNESNNVSFVAITVVADDFYISDAEVDLTDVMAGKALRASCNQVYDGNSSSSMYPDVGYYLSIDNVLDNSDQLLGSDESELSSGSPNEAETADLTIPSDTPDGNYFILFIADHLDEYNEGDESNNVSNVAIHVETIRHDFYIRGTSVSPTIVNPGNTVSVSCTHVYDGNSTSTLFPDVGYYLSTDNILDPDDQLIGSNGSTLSSSSPTESESAVMTLPFVELYQTYYILFVADNNDEYEEEDEINNVNYVAIQIDPPECNEPDNLLAERTGPETASLSWSTVSGITGYDMEYRLKNSLTWEYQPVNVNNHQLSNLICDTSYEWRVRANCGNGVYSDWKQGNVLKTAACDNTAVHDLSIYDLIVYPNPTSDHLYIKSQSSVYNSCILSVMDISGKVLYQKNIEALEPDDIHVINVSEFENGIYILKIYNKNIMAIDRIIIDH